MSSPLRTTEPAAPHPDGKRRIAAIVEDARGELLGLSHRIHANPEPAFEEHRAAAWCAEVLTAHGFTVELPAGRLATAIRATRPGGRGGPGPRIGILAEYDALPGLGRGGGDRPGRCGRPAARRDRLPRDPGRRTGERQALHD